MEAGTRAHGPLPAADVWERYAEPARWPQWAPQITAVETDVDRIVVGARGRVRGPLGVRVSFVVTEVDEAARVWAWVVSFGPLRLRLRHGVDTLPDGGSTTWLVTEGPPPVLALYLPIARIALHKLTRP